MNENITENIFFERGYQKGYENAFETVSQKIDKQLQAGWIKIEDKKPDEDRLLFYLFDKEFLSAGGYYGLNKEGEHVFGGCSGMVEGEVTHWMYAPPVPKEYEGLGFSIEDE